MRTSTHSFFLPARHLLLVALASLGCSAAQAGYDDGVTAYQRGRHDLALREFQDAAARGDARALRSLGLMHERGDGVPRDPAQAADCYRRAVLAGLEGAHYNLAFVVPQHAAGASGPVQFATSRP